MRNLKPSLIAVASALLLTAGTAMAQAPAPAPAPAPSFDELDRDGDGYISKAEAMALPCVGDNFEALAPQNDRGLSRLEYNAAVQRYCQ